jgi:hypothetical protein
MRKTAVVATLLVLALAWAGYVAWPIYTLVKVTRALERGDAATVVQHVDFGAVRISLTEQIVDAYLKQSGKPVSPLLRGIARSAGSIAEPVVGRIVTPQALTEFLRTGWPTTVIAERPRDAAGLTPGNLGNAWQIFAAGDYGLRRFDIAIPASVPRDRQFRFRFRLKQWRWQLSGIRLPDSIRVLLVEALVSALKQPR